MSNNNTNQKGYGLGSRKANFFPNRGANYYPKRGPISFNYYPPTVEQVRVEIEMEMIARAVFEYKRALRGKRPNAEYLEQIKRFRDVVLVSLGKIEEMMKAVEVVYNNNNTGGGVKNE